MSRFPRVPRHIFEPFVDPIVDALTPAFDRVVICGSLRRGLATVSDIDVVVSGPHVSDVDITSIISSITPVVSSSTFGANARMEVVLDGGWHRVPVDVWIAEPDALGAAVLYATGSGTWNVIMRRWARANGMDVLFTGVWRDGRRVAAQTEADCFSALGWPWQEPEDRCHRSRVAGMFVDRMDGASVE
ncbi:MAG: hypothetical protein A3E78_08445 [Alphaproteobacteria bacterium RIFCSPHIGHO2_12_FULL_63_12]|nr:MAG: hypothetical protein A3E78_08445 [Alphaproteobacteria bacterium RIFCSPHIGHO2_12_FULL_63_12]